MVDNIQDEEQEDFFESNMGRQRVSTAIRSAETIASDVAMTTVIVHFKRICQYLPRRQV